MRLSVLQVVAALAAAVCVVIAFIAAGLDAISDLFLLLAILALGFIAWSAVRRALASDRQRASTTRTPARPEP